ncbi:MAG: nuclear transport factor 2 family protein, partial [Gammaproteobacteria bacterium]|nr:nuclear transport factor 2 family protein [Gammaproteobacteria bacterium]
YDTTRTLTLRSGRLAIEQGVYRVRNVRHGEDVEQGQYLAVWKKLDGDWRIFRSIFNTEFTMRSEVTMAPEPSP